MQFSFNKVLLKINFGRIWAKMLRHRKIKEENHCLNPKKILKV